MQRMLLGYFGLVTMVCTSAGAAPRSHSAWMIDDFNTGMPNNWVTWCDSQSTTPTMALCDDAAEGSGAWQLTFPNSGQTALCAKQFVKIPASADSLAFWIKTVAGDPQMTIMLEETSDGDGGGDCFRASLPVAPDGTWRREVIPLSAFHYVYAKGNRGNGKLDRRRPMHLAFIVYNCPRSFSVRIDALQWMRTAQRSAALTTQTSQPVRSKNLLPGDTSFETGIGTWSYMQQVGEPRTVVGDAAFGQRCLALSKGEPGVQSGWTYDLLKAGAPHVLSFYAKGQPGSKVNIGVMGMDWIVVGGATFDVTNEWKQYHYVVPVQSGTLTAYMGFSAVPIDASPVLIDALQLEAGTTPTAYEPAEAIVLAAGIDATAQIAVARKDAPPTMTVRISNARLSDDRQPMTLGATIKQFDGPVLSQFSESITLKSGASWEKSIPMTMAAEPGYTVVDWVLRDAHDAIVAKMQSPFVVVPESVATSEVPVLRDGFFGIHSHWVPADAMRRIGVTWIRSGLPPWD